MRISSTIHPIMSILNSADIYITWFISYILALLTSIRHYSQQINLVHDSFVEVQFNMPLQFLAFPTMKPGASTHSKYKENRNYPNIRGEYNFFW